MLAATTRCAWEHSNATGKRSTRGVSQHGSSLALLPMRKAPPYAPTCCIGLDAAANDRAGLRLEAPTRSADHTGSQRALKPKLRGQGRAGQAGHVNGMCLNRSVADPIAHHLN